MHEILDRIYKARKIKNITQKEICEKIGISQSAFDNWKKGKNESLKKYIPQIAEILGVTMEYLISGKESEADAFYKRYLELPENLQKAIDLIMK